MDETTYAVEKLKPRSKRTPQPLTNDTVRRVDRMWKSRARFAQAKWNTVNRQIDPCGNAGHRMIICSGEAKRREHPIYWLFLRRYTGVKAEIIFTLPPLRYHRCLFRLVRRLNMSNESRETYIHRSLPAWFNGTRYRSRLEGRWAVLLTLLDIKFDYEPEGLDLGGGIWYLPDFYLPHVGMWAEVKPEACTETERKKCRLLADVTGRPCLRLEGTPALTTYWANLADPNEEFDESDFLLDIYYHRRKLYDRERRFFGSTMGWPEENFTSAYRAAVAAARSFRFDRRAA